MSEMDLFRAIGEINDKYIEEADREGALSQLSENARKTRKNRASRIYRLIPGVAVAACLVVVAGLALRTGTMKMGSSAPMAENSAATADYAAATAEMEEMPTEAYEETAEEAAPQLAANEIPDTIPETTASKAGEETKEVAEATAEAKEESLFGPDGLSDHTVILSLAEGTTKEQILSLCETYGLELLYDYDSLGMCALTSPEALSEEEMETLLENLRAEEFVLDAERDSAVQLDADETKE